MKRWFGKATPPRINLWVLIMAILAIDCALIWVGVHNTGWFATFIGGQVGVFAAWGSKLLDKD